jgi:hypothetical protein
MNRRELMIAVAAATMAVTVSWAAAPPPPPPPPPAPTAVAAPVRAWESFCIGTDKAGVGQAWANEDLDKENGWNRVIAHYASQGWEPFQIITGTPNRGVAVISAACFRRPGG